MLNLTSIDWGANMLSGTIPDELVTLPQLQTLCVGHLLAPFLCTCLSSQGMPAVIRTGGSDLRTDIIFSAANHRRGLQLRELERAVRHNSIIAFRLNHHQHDLSVRKPVDRDAPGAWSFFGCEPQRNVRNERQHAATHLL